MMRTVLLMLCLGIAACGSRPEAVGDDDPDIDGNTLLPSSGAYGDTGYGSGSAYRDEEDFDEDRARDAAEEELASDTYGASMAYGCTYDCSGHEAGWDYQGQSGYGSPYSGRSQSFIEGRQAFDEAVDERVEEMRQDFEDARANGDDYGYDY